MGSEGSMIDGGDTGACHGDLSGMVAEAFGWAADCGRAFRSIPAVLSHIEATYDGGLAEFALNTAVLAT